MALNYRPSPTALGQKDTTDELRMQVRSILGVDDETVISVAEHCCGDPTCDETATTIVVIRPSQPIRGAKIAKPLKAITEDDLHMALSTLR